MDMRISFCLVLLFAICFIGICGISSQDLHSHKNTITEEERRGASSDSEKLKKSELEKGTRGHYTSATHKHQYYYPGGGDYDSQVSSTGHGYIGGNSGHGYSSGTGSGYGSGYGGYGGYSSGGGHQGGTRPYGGVGGYGHDGYNGALALKGLLIPLAGIALLGAAAALSTNPVLLQLGVVNGRRKRSVLEEYSDHYPVNPHTQPDGI